MESSALDSAESWLAVIWWAKLVAAGLVAIGVAMQFGGDWIAAPFEKTVAEARKLEIAKLEARALDAEKDIAKANEIAAKANERAAVRKQNRECPGTWAFRKRGQATLSLIACNARLPNREGRE